MLDMWLEQGTDLAAQVSGGMFAVIEFLAIGSQVPLLLVIDAI
jgi:hypothetical protein